MRGKVRGFSIVRGSALIDQINKPHPFLRKLLSSHFKPMMFWLFSILGVAAAFNNPPGVDIWCGKAYYPT